MNFSEFCIKRPVFTTVMMFIMMVVGVVSYTYLNVRQYPQVDKPVVSVRTSYEGASPEIIEIQVTRILEGALAGIEGMDYMTSVSEQENSRIDMTFKPHRKLDDAANDVRDRVARVAANLPKEAHTPMIKKTDSDAEPIVYLAITSDEAPIYEIFDYADKYLKSEIEALNGVASIEVYGSGKMAMHLWLDPEKMASKGIAATDIAEALRAQNVEVPAGRLTSTDKEFMVTTSANLQTEKDFNQLVLHESQGYAVRLQDVGYAEFSPDDDRTYVSLNGKQGVGIEVVKKSTANPLDLSADIARVLPDIQAHLPKGMKIEVAYDKSEYIASSISAVYRTIWEAVVLVVLVVLAFLWSPRGALVPVVTIPVSLVGVFTLMYAFGFSVNILTLLAMVLSIGLVVDDAIVMLENIYRHIEEGMAPMKAAIVGAREISFAVIAMTLTLVAVYAPIALSQGMIGKIFTEFALTLAGAVFISGFVALSLSPMMCARLLSPPDHHAQTLNIKVLDALDQAYQRALAYVLSYRWTVVGIALAVALGGGALTKYGLKTELTPADDKGMIYGRAEGERDATLKNIMPYIHDIEDIFRSQPEVKNQFTVVTTPTSATYNTLIPWSERTRSASQIVQAIKEQLWSIPGVGAWPSLGGSFFGGGSSESLQLVIQTTLPYEELVARGQEIMTMAGQNKAMFSRPELNISPPVLEYYVDIDREKASRLGISAYDIATTLDTVVSGRVFTKLKQEGQQYDVRAQLMGDKRMKPADLDLVFMRGKSGRDTFMVPLSTLADLKQRPVATEINHFNQLRSLTFTAMINEGHTLGDALDFVYTMKEALLDGHFKLDFMGDTRRYLESQNTLYLIFALALLFIYLIMAAQFESFRDPLIIMFSVPLSLTGALIGLWMTKGTLNIFSQIGLVTLIGLITKHGILIVDFANKLQIEGHPIYEAILKAARLRLRPILMTTAAMVLGAVPLAIATGAGAEGRQQIGIVIVFGMTFGTLLTLFVVPVVYVMMGRQHSKALSSDMTETPIIIN